MPIELTNEIKVKIFAQYLGQKVISNSPSKSNGILYKTCVINTYACFMDKEGSYHDFNVFNLRLILRPLSSITEQELIELCDVDYGEASNLLQDKIEAGNYIVNEMRKGQGTFMAHQYLQNNGFDLPHYLLGFKTLHEAGFCIYE